MTASGVASSDGIFRDGATFTVWTTAGALPGICVRCGAPCTTRVKRTFHWHTPWLLLLVPFGLVIYAIVAAAVQKTFVMSVPLCRKDARARSTQIALGAALAVFALPLGIVLGVKLSISIWVAGAIAFATFAGGLVFAFLASTILRPRFVDSTRATFAGASEAFLTRLPPRQGG